MKQIIYKTPADFDSDNVHWQVGKEKKGFGYRGKDDNKIGLITCPKCDLENYAMAVSAGICAFCGFDANEE